MQKNAEGIFRSKLQETIDRTIPKFETKETSVPNAGNCETDKG
jgi:hypothetical protein